MAPWSARHSRRRSPRMRGRRFPRRLGNRKRCATRDREHAVLRPRAEARRARSAACRDALGPDRHATGPRAAGRVAEGAVRRVKPPARARPRVAGFGRSADLALRAAPEGSVPGRNPVQRHRGARQRGALAHAEGGRALLPELVAADAPRPDLVRFILSRSVTDFPGRLARRASGSSRRAPSDRAAAARRSCRATNAPGPGRSSSASAIQSGS